MGALTFASVPLLSGPMLHRILIADDDQIQRFMVRRGLEGEIDAEFVEAADGEEALAHLTATDHPAFSLLLLDLGMPRLDGMGLLQKLRGLGHPVRTVVITGSDRVEDAVEAMRLGAVDFIAKPVQRERLITSARNALAMHDLQEEVSRLQQDRQPVYDFAHLVGISPGLSAAAALGKKAAASDIPVLITGESGVGKEVFARAIHLESARRDRAMVAVNCGALPENLVESTLFGHEKGAFTGAMQRSIGKCREADGGVLFLDEIGDLKLETQVKLLRLLQEGEIEPVGSSKTVKVDVRVISATNHTLEQRVRDGKFREDLYYRLQGFPVHLPALRDRQADIAPLAMHLLSRIAMAEQRPHLTLAPDALAWLGRQHWLGNVRELQHLLHRSALMSDSDTMHEADCARWMGSGLTAPKATSQTSVELFDARGVPRPLAVIEQEIIARMLTHHDAHIGKTAAALGIGQSTLYKRLKPE